MMLKCIGVSAGLHVTAAIVLLLFNSQPSIDRAPGTQSSSNPSLMADIGVRPRSVPAFEDSDGPINYLGAPHHLLGEKRTNDQPTPGAVAQTLSRHAADLARESSPTNEPEQALPVAETVSDRGLLAPVIVAELNDAIVERLLHSRVAVIGIKIDGRVTTFDGANAAMLDESSSESFSPRALALPPSLAIRARALQSCSRSLGFPHARLAAAPSYLLVRKDLDSAILTEQRKAAENQGLSLSDISRTRGRFILNDQMFGGYAIELIELRDGGSILIGGSS